MTTNDNDNDDDANDDGDDETVTKTVEMQMMNTNCKTYSKVFKIDSMQLILLFFTHH